MSGWTDKNRFAVHVRGNPDQEYCAATIDRNIGLIRVEHLALSDQAPLILGKQGAKNLGMALIQLSNELPHSLT